MDSDVDLKNFWEKSRQLLGKKQFFEVPCNSKPFYFIVFPTVLAGLIKVLLLFYRFCFAHTFWMSVLWQHVCFPLRDIYLSWGHRAQKGSQTLQGNLHPKESVSAEGMFLLVKPLVAGWTHAPLGSQVHPCFPSPHTPSLSLWLFSSPFNTKTVLLIACPRFKRVSVHVCAIFPAGPTHLSGKDLNALRIL